MLAAGRAAVRWVAVSCHVGRDAMHRMKPSACQHLPDWVGRYGRCVEQAGWPTLSSRVWARMWMRKEVQGGQERLQGRRIWE